MFNLLPLIHPIPDRLMSANAPYRIAVTGEKHVGKTTALKAIFELLKAKHIDAAGFIEKAVFMDDQRVGYDFLDLRTRERAIVARRQAARVPYIFEEHAWDWAKRILRSSESSQVLLIDELGRLEAAGNGLMPALRDSLERHPRHLIASVREDAFGLIEAQLGAFDETLVISTDTIDASLATMKSADFSTQFWME